MTARRRRFAAPIEEVLDPCGSEINLSPVNGMTDERGHPIGYYHEHAATLGIARVAGILDLHRIDPEGIVPTCIECGKVAPCPTRGIATGLIE